MWPVQFFPPSVPPDFLSFHLGEAQKINSRTLALSDTARAVPPVAVEKDFISNVLNIQYCFGSH